MINQCKNPDCKSDFQDKEYKGLRVFTEATVSVPQQLKNGKTVYVKKQIPCRCTVCSSEHESYRLRRK